VASREATLTGPGTRELQEDSTMPVTHQTIKLSRGKHLGPQEGACVMELASMLAGERFSDQPASVCPVIGSLLRSYNDAVDDERRQDLYRYAASVVGTAGSLDTRMMRIERLTEWMRERSRTHKLRTALRSCVRLLGAPPATSASAGVLAVRSISRHTDRTHAEVLALIDELIDVGAQRPAQRTYVHARARRSELDLAACRSPGDGE
jgi:hypothetical protein